MPKLKWVYIKKNGAIWYRFRLFGKLHTMGPFLTEDGAHMAASMKHKWMLDDMERKRGYAQIQRGETGI